MGETLQTPESINFTISFDKETIVVDAQNISGQGTRTVSNPNENSLIIQSIPSEIVDKSQSILMLPFSGAQKDILLSEAVARLKNGKAKDLSI